MLTESPKGESDHITYKVVITYEVVYEMVKQYRPYFRILMNGDKYYAEDLEQELLLKFLKRFKKEPDWKIESEKALIIVSALNMANTMRKRIPIDHVSIDDEENSDVRNNLSDGGILNFQMNKDLDYEPYRLQMANVLQKDFSKYDQTLIQLNFFKGCKPAHIAEIVIKDYPELVEQEYPDMWSNKNSKNVEHLKKFIQTDCYTASSNFHQKLKQIAKDIDM